jgi:hypothetical protein
MVDVMLIHFRTFAVEVGDIARLVEQDCPDTGFGPTGVIRWWRGEGWDLVRAADGTWMGWPMGEVTHPPLYAQVYPNTKAEIIAAVGGFGGFVLPPQMPYAARFEEALCHGASSSAQPTVHHNSGGGVQVIVTGGNANVTIKNSTDEG